MHFVNLIPDSGLRLLGNYFNYILGTLYSKCEDKQLFEFKCTRVC